MDGETIEAHVDCDIESSISQLRGRPMYQSIRHPASNISRLFVRRQKHGSGFSLMFLPGEKDLGRVGLNSGWMPERRVDLNQDIGNSLRD
jgi:hypothetical protein